MFAKNHSVQLFEEMTLKNVAGLNACLLKELIGLRLIATDKAERVGTPKIVFRLSVGLALKASHENILHTPLHYVQGVKNDSYNFIFSDLRRCAFVSLRHNVQLAGAYDIKNHILNRGKHATARELKNRSIAPMGEREKKR